MLVFCGNVVCVCMCMCSVCVCVCVCVYVISVMVSVDVKHRVYFEYESTEHLLFLLEENVFFSLPLPPSNLDKHALKLDDFHSQMFKTRIVRQD